MQYRSSLLDVPENGFRLILPNHKNIDSGMNGSYHWIRQQENKVDKFCKQQLKTKAIKTSFQKNVEITITEYPIHHAQYHISSDQIRICHIQIKIYIWQIQAVASKLKIPEIRYGWGSQGSMAMSPHIDGATWKPAMVSLKKASGLSR